MLAFFRNEAGAGRMLRFRPQAAEATPRRIIGDHLLPTGGRSRPLEGRKPGNCHRGIIWKSWAPAPSRICLSWQPPLQGQGARIWAPVASLAALEGRSSAECQSGQAHIGRQGIRISHPVAMSGYPALHEALVHFGQSVEDLSSSGAKLGIATNP